MLFCFHSVSLSETIFGAQPPAEAALARPGKQRRRRPDPAGLEKSRLRRGGGRGTHAQELGCVTTSRGTLHEFIYFWGLLSIPALESGVYTLDINSILLVLLS